MPVQTLVATPDPEPHPRRSSERQVPAVTSLAAFRIPEPGDLLWPGMDLGAGARLVLIDDSIAPGRGW
ncbi:hypothetical protein FRAHR75_770018 [Frankia sp. Hr75.2]|nr:hypothetical protein FRAHR75_770018 [Frankia sp. Hr75.2]